MEQTTTAAIHHDHNVGGGRKEIYRVTIILSVLTFVELAFGFSMYYIKDTLTIHFIKGVIVILMLAKAFYIVGYFMHLKHEKLNMAYTILLPMIFILYLVALLMFEGSGVGGNY